MDGALSAADARRALGRFAARDVTRGRAYYAEGRVEALKPPMTVGELLLYTARVRGSARQPYTAYLTFSAQTRAFLDSECTCPLGGSCKHAVAALEALAADLDRVPDAGSGARRAVRLDPRVETWLTSLTLAVRPPEPPADRGERLLFRLRIEPIHLGGERLLFHVDRAALQPDGSYTAGRRVALASLHWTRDPAVSPGDRELLMRLGDLRPGEWAIDWSLPGAWLSEVVATGRAFLQRGNAWHTLAVGDRRVGELSFSTDARGWQQPRLTGPGFTHVLPFVPPLYLDASSGLLGEIEVPGVPAAFAQAWHRGAPVSPIEAEEVGRRLTTATPQLSPPAPRVRARRTIVTEPVMILRLESQLAEPPAPTSWGSVFPPPGRPWVRVSFDYAGERVDPRDDSPERVTDTEILEVDRSYEAEHSNTSDATLEAAFLVGGGLLVAAGLATTFWPSSSASSSASVAPRVGPHTAGLVWSGSF